MVLDLIKLACGVLLLWFAADYLVKGAAAIAARFQIPPMIIGLTVVAFGTSAPELIVSLSAALVKDSTDMALGNVVGSNIANILLVLGACSLVRHIPVDRKMMRFEMPFLVVMTLFTVFLARTGFSLSLIDGFIMLAMLVLFLVLTFKLNKNKNVDPEIEELIHPEDHKPFLDIIYLAGGIAGLVLGANFLVESASSIALEFGISPMFISLTVVAIGTSLPELAASGMAAYRGETELCLGNVVGSNIFNIGSVLAATSIVKTIRVEARYINGEMLWMAAVTVGLYFLCRFNNKLTKRYGAALLAIYVFFVLNSFTPQ